MSTKVSLRLSDDVLQAVDEAAERGGRNRTQQIEWMLKAAFREFPAETKGVMPSEPKPNRVAAMTATAKTAVVAESDEVKDPKNFEKQRRETGMESQFRTSPDGKPCKHMLYRCDRGCWK